MTPTTLLERLAQMALVVFVCAAIAAFGSSYDQAAAWLFWLPCLLSPFWRIPRLPKTLDRTARALAWLALALTTVLGLIFMGFPVLSDQTAVRFSLFSGYGLAFFSSLFLLGRPVWPPALTLLPAAIGLLVVACFNPTAKIKPLLLAPGGAAFAYLVLTRLEGIGWKELRRQAIRLVVAAAGCALVAGTIIVTLPWLQRQVELATARWAISQTSEYSTLSMQSRLGDLQELKLSQKVVLRVWSLRPQKLRGRVFVRFDGQTWHARPAAGAPLLPALAEIAPVAGVTDWLDDVPGSLFWLPGKDSRQLTPGAVHTKIVQAAFNPGLMVSPANKLLVRAPLDNLRVDAYETLTLPLFASVQVYGVVNQLGAAGIPAGPEIGAESLALPADTDPRWKALAARLREGTTSVEERIEKTVGYVENAAEYSLQVGKFRSNQPVAEFFFEKKRGYCQYFASAAAILLRQQGIPARYVTGFNVQEWNRPGGHFVVREADAHAWLEAYVPGKGWVEADPTPEAEFEARRRSVSSGWLAQAGEWLAAEFADVSTRLRAGDWRGAGRWAWAGFLSLLRAVFITNLGVTLLLAALVILWATRQRWLRRLRARARGRAAAGMAPPPAELRELVSRLDNGWARGGFPRPRSSALLEHLESIPRERISAELRAASRDAVECFYRAAFGGQPAPAGELRRLREALDRALSPVP